MIKETVVLVVYSYKLKGQESRSYLFLNIWAVKNTVFECNFLHLCRKRLCKQSKKKQQQKDKSVLCCNVVLIHPPTDSCIYKSLFIFIVKSHEDLSKLHDKTLVMILSTCTSLVTPVLEFPTFLTQFIKMNHYQKTKQFWCLSLSLSLTLFP